MDNKNKMSEVEFLDSFNHPRHRALAKMILDGESVESMNEAGFARINILEMVNKISGNIEGREDFQLDIPLGEGEKDLAGAEEVADANDTEKKSAPEQSPEQSDASIVKDSEDDIAAMAGMNDAEKADYRANREANGGAHPTETIGGNPTPTSGEGAEANDNK